MTLYIIRHSDAVGSQPGVSDFDRILTPEGEKRIKHAAKSWKKVINQFDFIVTSPFLRAHQTAHIIKEVFGFKEDLIIDERLSCGSKTDDIIEIANSLGGQKIAFVGHAPDVSYHVSELASSAGVNTNFQKAMIAAVSFLTRVRAGAGTLEFLLPTSAIK